MFVLEKSLHELPVCHFCIYTIISPMVITIRIDIDDITLIQKPLSSIALCKIYLYLVYHGIHHHQYEFFLWSFNRLSFPTTTFVVSLPPYVHAQIELFQYCHSLSWPL